MARRAQLAGSILLSAGLVGAAVAPLAAANAASASHSLAAASHKGTKIATVKTSLGRIVSNHKGRAMFRFMKDTHGKSHCSASCQGIWPPVMSKGKPRAAAHISKSRLGRTKKGQVTYYGHPLYYYSGDPKPGKTTGDGLKEFGAHWYVVSPHGKPVKPKKHGGGGSGGTVTPPSGPAEVSTGTVDAGTVLTNGANNHTLYELSSETGSPANFDCVGTCFSDWHPLLTKGAPTVSGSADSGQLDTVNRHFNGHTYAQVTYNNHPLYAYVGDHAAGDGNGERIYDPPGYWYELMPNGTQRL